MYKTSCFCFLFLLFVFSSCVKNNQNPTWIEIDKWTIVENPDEAGAAGILSHQFDDVYISIDGKIIGYFELPVKIPLLLEGQKEIKLYPVVRNNGISATKKSYPFCSTFDTVINMEIDKVHTIKPSTHYLSNLSFWVEDFEDASTELTPLNGNLALLQKKNDPNYVKYGNFYGYIELNKIDSVFAYESIPFYNVPKAGAEVYLEIDYMTSNSFLTSLNASINGYEKTNPNISLNSFDYANLGWKKIYIDLKELVSSQSTAVYFKHVFSASLDVTKSESKIFIDNIRFLYKK
ncbi:MAG: hypothetical protein HYU67_07005 [Flavobacteriia bacterium]|nr:hypothetical protein [Flavobacteriia bacterium]